MINVVLGGKKTNKKQKTTNQKKKTNPPKKSHLIKIYLYKVWSKANQFTVKDLVIDSL